MDEEETGAVDESYVPIGERLKAARNETGQSIEEVAAETRIPQRHIRSLEAGDWAALPAPTYTIGFSKTLAERYGLDVSATAAEVREEMGAAAPPMAEVGGYEIADPKRGMPGWVIIVAIAAIILAVLLFSWMNDQRLVAEERAEDALAQSEADDAANTPTDIPPAEMPVLLIAEDQVWLQVTDGGTTLFSGELARGDTYRVPDDAEAPMLETARPEWLRIRVGSNDIPQLAEDGVRVRNVSLLGEDLTAQPEAEAEPEPEAPARTATAPAPAPQRTAPQPTPQRQSSPTTQELNRQAAARAQEALEEAQDTAAEAAEDEPPAPPPTPPAETDDGGEAAAEGDTATE
ncbi:helix-turn-helix domain-containing protein [Sphingomicrobium sediminis]|uniref:Helix-turn-helix domain-containing protein n=1 Tax=Sphingomicrobium sediminis TaxID=2950949 RepID=A0A9X2EGP3_9SPHN|nr:RodZ domain-containing protein [Sphingomicrobium sediminis]MCM8557688.1 helix-turn-helix domain-containing protein [Sphingomicrobium sediminis]